MHGKKYFTKRGYEKHKKKLGELTQELERLQGQTSHAAEVGGNQYHDNASYELLVIDIRGVNSRVAEFHQILSGGEIISPPTSTKRVAIGTHVSFERNGIKEGWDIVGFAESEPDKKYTAYNTPLGTLLIGTVIGQTVTSTIADKPVTIRILEISISKNNEDEE